MHAHDLEWFTPAPLWKAVTGSSSAMRRPAILGFKSDAFMEDLFRLLETNPEGLADVLARPEKGGEPPTGGRAEAPVDPGELRLYQPVHGRFYLVAASLVCRRMGLPDHRADLAGGEQPGFVLRRVDAAGDEYALVGREGGLRVWQKLGSDARSRVAEGEEMLPAFPVDFPEGGRRRRMLAGLVPVATREALEATPVGEDSAPRGATTKEEFVAERMEELERRVLAPLAMLRTKADLEASRFLLLDFADILATHLEPFWRSLPDKPAQAKAQALYDVLGSRVGAAPPSPAPAPPTFRQALVAVYAQRDLINGLRDAKPGEKLFEHHLQGTELQPEALKQAFKAAVEAYAPSFPAPSPSPAAPGEGRYITRFILKRPPCRPSGPPLADVVSDPSERFVLSSYFDPDAPARPIRIVLPAQTGIAALRKFKRSVGFAMSSEMRAQVNRVSDLKKLLDGEVPPPSPGGGAEICTFSIPIITIIAMIVMTIFMILLNIIFRWLPFIRICLPLGPKAKG